MIKPNLTANELRAWRNRLGLTQSDLAGRLGVSRITYNKWENDLLIKGVPLWVKGKLEILEDGLKQTDTLEVDTLDSASDLPDDPDEYLSESEDKNDTDDERFDAEGWPRI